MADSDDAQSKWLPVIAKSLAYLCLRQAKGEEPERFDSVLKRVKFLEGLGLSRDHAASAAGSSAHSVRRAGPTTEEQEDEKCHRQKERPLMIPGECESAFRRRRRSHACWGCCWSKISRRRQNQVPLLRAVGFEVSEVAAMLGITENHVKVADHHGRKKKRAR